MSDLPQCIEENIRRHRLFSRGQRILVAVSGGLDSMVLLQVLHQLSAQNGWRLVVAHLNHRLRGVSGNADERLVRRTAQRLGLPSVVERADVRALAREHKLSLEMAARKARHQFLAQTAARLKIRRVALAHHADDQVELFFLRLLRGSGGEGLAGMKWRGPSPFSRRVDLVRPLLSETKEGLRQYACALKVEFREDASNSSLEMQRNRIRHELLPLLRRSYQPALLNTIRRVAEIAGADSEFATQAATEWLAAMRNANSGDPKGQRSHKAPAAFSTLHVALQRRCLLLQLLEMGVAPDFQLVEQLRNTIGQPVMAPASSGDDPAVIDSGHPSRPSKKSKSETFSILRTEAGLLQRVPAPSPAFQVRQLPLDLGNGAGTVEFDGLQVRWRVDEKRGVNSSSKLQGKELFDFEKVGQKVILRRWVPGDRFQPIGMSGTIKLQDFFTNQKVPRSRRHELLIATTASGKIFWVENMRISERFKLTNTTIRRLLWAWERI